MQEGQIIGKYRIGHLCGSGGMANVYTATDSLGRQLAIKAIRVDNINDSLDMQKAQDLFWHEIRIISAFDHPHILALYDLVEVPNSPQICMVMPFQRHGSLANWLKERRRNNEPALSLAEVSGLLMQAADALQYVHDRKIVHRDVKPQNFLLRGETHQRKIPDLLLSDFGIAKSITSQLHTNTRGTPAYIAPEQWKGEPPNVASDQYALACMAYELLTGRPPFQGTDPDIIGQQHLGATPVAPGSQNPGLPRAYDAIILRALAKKPEDRFPSVSEFAAAFARIQSSDAPTINNVAVPPVSPATHPRSSYFLLLSALLACGLLVGSMVGFLAGLRNRPPVPSPTPVAGPIDTAVAATQIAGAAATATALPTSIYISSTNGIPLLYDNLHSDDESEDHGRWQELANICFFDGQYYQVIDNFQTVPTNNSPNFQVCPATSPVLHLTRFAFRIKMLVRHGNSGGILFDATQNASSFYYFRLSDGGGYEFGASDNGTSLHSLATGSAKNLLPSYLAGTTITLTVIATTPSATTPLTYYFYVENHCLFQIDQTQIARTGFINPSGYPGALAINGSSVWFEDAAVWTL